MKNEFQSQTFKKFMYIQEKAICKCICIDLCKVGKIHVHVYRWCITLTGVAVQVHSSGRGSPPPTTLCSLHRHADWTEQ